MTATTLTLLTVLATLAFGAVYPWAYLPLFAAATAIGLLGMFRRRGVLPELRPLSAGLALLLLAVGAQLVPISRATLLLPLSIILFQGLRAIRSALLSKHVRTHVEEVGSQHRIRLRMVAIAQR